MNAEHRDAWVDSIRYDAALFAAVEVAGGISVAVIVGYGAYRRFAPLLCPRRNVELSLGPQAAPGFFDRLHDALNPWGGGVGGGGGEPELDPRTGALRYKGVLYARVPLQEDHGGEYGSEDERGAAAAR